MKKNEFLTTNAVQNFIHWLEKKMDQTDSFSHGYTMKKPIMIGNAIQFIQLMRITAEHSDMTIP